MNYDFVIKRGDTFQRLFRFTTDTGSAIDIMTSTFKLFVVKKGHSRKEPKITYDSVVGAELKVTGNQVEFLLSDEATLDYPSDAAYYYLCQFFPDGSVKTKVEGTIKVAI